MSGFLLSALTLLGIYLLVGLLIDAVLFYRWGIPDTRDAWTAAAMTVLVWPLCISVIIEVERKERETSSLSAEDLQHPTMPHSE